MCGSGVMRTSPLQSSIAVVQARPLLAVHVHRAGTADAFAAGAAEGQRRVLLDFILISASSTIGPQLSRSISNVSYRGFS
jgi:hypothetical protein